MVVLGVILLVGGFVMITPRDSTPGSAAIRNVDVGIHGIYETPGYQRVSNERRWTVVRVVGGLLAMAGGIALIALGS